jgi:hypothetical protein
MEAVLDCFSCLPAIRDSSSVVPSYYYDVQDCHRPARAALVRAHSLSPHTAASNVHRNLQDKHGPWPRASRTYIREENSYNPSSELRFPRIAGKGYMDRASRQHRGPAGFELKPGARRYRVHNPRRARAGHVLYPLRDGTWRPCIASSELLQCSR